MNSHLSLKKKRFLIYDVGFIGGEMGSILDRIEKSTMMKKDVCLHIRKK